jgi:hypothetical protein
LSVEVGQLLPLAATYRKLRHVAGTLMEQAIDTLLADAGVAHVSAVNLGGRLHNDSIDRL